MKKGGITALLFSNSQLNLTILLEYTPNFEDLRNILKILADYEMKFIFDLLISSDSWAQKFKWEKK